MKAKASVEQKANGISKKTTMDHSEEQSIEEETQSKESKPAALRGIETLAITSGGQEDATKERKVIKKKAKKPDDSKDNISVVSEIYQSEITRVSFESFFCFCVLNVCTIA